MKFKFSFLACIIFCLIAFTSCINSNDILIDDKVEIYISDNEPQAVKIALNALVLDFERVMGFKPHIVNSLDSITSQTAIVVFSQNNAIASLEDKEVAGWESHSLQSQKLGGRNYLVAQGFDLRGTIYAIYTLSEKVLGVPPLYNWIDWKPVHKEQILIPKNSRWFFSSPYIKWRVWFLNDTDMIEPWRIKDEDHYRIIFESMLRLKVNSAEGWHNADRETGYVPYTTGKYYQMANKFGLSVTGHHTMSLSSNNTDWEYFWPHIFNIKAPRKSCKDTLSLDKYWLYHIQTSLKNELDPLWNIGFRGAGDVPFWKGYLDAPESDKERAKVIEGMPHRQIALIKKETGKADPDMRWTLYYENSEYLAKGLIIPPKEKNLIWVFVNNRRDHFPDGAAMKVNIPEGQKYGYYYHFQFTSTGAHYAQAEGLWKMEANLRMMDARAKQSMSLVVFNVGNVREFLTEISGGSTMLWNFEQYNTDRFLNDFFTQYFGSENANAVKGVYTDFINSYWKQKKPDLKGFDNQYIFQDLRYMMALNRILEALLNEKSLNPLYPGFSEESYFGIDIMYLEVNNQAEAMIKGTSESIKKLELLSEKAEVVLKKLDQGNTFFYEQYKLQIKYMLHLNKALYYASKSLLASSDQEMKGQLQFSFDHFEKLRTLYAPANRRVFNEWYYFVNNKSKTIHEMRTGENDVDRVNVFVSLRERYMKLLNK